MKNKFIISYDLVDKKTEEYQDLYDLFNNIGAIQIQKSLYSLKSNKNARELKDMIKMHIHSNDRLFIAKLNQWSSFNHINSIKDL